MGSEIMNLIQVISGGQKFIFPVTYVHLQAVFMIIPMLPSKETASFIAAPSQVRVDIRDNKP